MKASKKKWACFLIAFYMSGNLAAEENTGTSAQRNKEGQDKSQSAPTAAGRTLEQFGKTSTGKSGAAPEMKPVAATSDNDSAAEKKPPGAPAGRLSPTVRRDPFRPFTLNARTSSKRRRENLSPLERYELGQLKLVAVIWNTKEPSAMVEDSSGLGYLVKVGTPIGSNEGKVKSIQRDGIVIEEFYVDLYGGRKKHEVNMRLSAENAG
jgi:type IV pilus assembly protein PilP